MSDELAELKAEIAALRRKVERHDDYIELSNLQRIYGYYVDKGLWDEAVELFVEDGTLEIAGRGVYVGRERIRSYLHALPSYGPGRLFNHMQLQPVIHVADDGQTAKARWRAFIQLATVDVEARWGEAIYENEYVKRDGRWRIAALHGFITYYCEYDKGLDKGGWVPLLRDIRGLQPDRPPTAEYEAFPEVFVPPFHYENPGKTGGDAA